jgi:hypothetical protein
MDALATAAIQSVPRFRQILVYSGTPEVLLESLN